MQARPDLQTLVSFPTKQVNSPDEDEWGTLKGGGLSSPVISFLGDGPRALGGFWVSSTYTRFKNNNADYLSNLYFAPIFCGWT